MKLSEEQRQVIVHAVDYYRRRFEEIKEISLGLCGWGVLCEEAFRELPPNWPDLLKGEINE